MNTEYEKAKATLKKDMAQLDLKVKSLWLRWEPYLIAVLAFAAGVIVEHFAAR